MTTVISVRGRNRDELLADPNFVYVGRPVYRGKVAWKGSQWANPFRVGITRREAIMILGRDISRTPRATHLDSALAVDFFRAWLPEQPLATRIGELRDKTLGCWCCDWAPPELVVTRCHAIDLAKAADAMEFAR